MVQNINSKQLTEFKCKDAVLVDALPEFNHKKKHIPGSINIPVDKHDREVKRTPNARNWRGNNYDQIDLEGTIALTNRSDRKVHVEIERRMLGHADKTDRGGELEQLNSYEDSRYGEWSGYPYWWQWYSWPHWWHQLNGIGTVSWTVDLAPGERVDLNYAWHYFWR